jgi:hypothetical protein
VSISDILGGDSAPLVLLFEERTYKAGALTQGLKSAFERWLIARAMGAAGENDRALSVVTRDVAKGVYSWHSEHCREALATFDGALKLACLLFKVTEDEMMRLIQARPKEVRALVQLALIESAPKEHRDKIIAAIRDEEEEVPND